MILFIRKLVEKLNHETPDWMTNSIILLDNASWHKSEETIKALEDMRVPLIFSAPYSYSGAPIELLFAALK